MQQNTYDFFSILTADILELTVRHLHKLRRQQRLAHANPVINEDRFRAGFTHAANEVSRILASIPGVDITLGTKLMTHLGVSLNSLDKNGPLSIQTPQNGLFSTPPLSPTSSLSSGYSSSRDNGVSVIMQASSAHHQTVLRAPTPNIIDNHHHHHYEPMTPLSSRCSQSSSPQPIAIDYRSATPDYGLLKVANFAQEIKTSSASLWRPF